MEAPARLEATPGAVWRGRAYPLGATWDGAGVNFALYSEHALGVELCLFDPGGRQEIRRLALRERTDFVWHGYLPGARPGLVYGYRVDGPDDPARGHRFNARNLLLDPYARLLDSASGMPRCRVVDPAFDWQDDRPPRTAWADTVIYELHVKGFTKRHPGVPDKLRGTYAGLASAPAIEHFKRLGVTAIELLPIHAFVDEPRLVRLGLRNYWGYNSIGFFAPDLRYCASGTLEEFKTMVKRLHAAGIEIILDVVYNHTGEGDESGPTHCFRGIDNAVYYRLDPNDPRRYLNYSGTGNSLNSAHPAVLALVMNSLRYWANEMHVDGFRFDLASTLARDRQGSFDPQGAFLNAVHQDPVISQLKLIAEPWDLGEGGYRLGGFPPGWSEWNDKYRDAVRAYWKGDGGLIGELASRLSGSSDLFERTGRGPPASVNYITAHDGFTLHDLVSYNAKHNEANGEGNRDGQSDNRSSNYGVEGPTLDPAIRALRERQKRNFLATLLFSQGVPMLIAGDELGRTQQGNNNAYCQDGELSWIDWELAPENAALLQLVSRLVHLRRAHPALRAEKFSKNITWLAPRGEEMSDAEWNEPSARCLGVYLSGRALAERDERGRPVEDDDLLLLLNAHDETIAFTLPGATALDWEVLVDTSFASGIPETKQLQKLKAYALQGRTLVLLRRERQRAP